MKDDDRLLEDADLYVTFFDGNRDRRKSVEIVSGLAAEVREQRARAERAERVAVWAAEQAVFTSHSSDRNGKRWLTTHRGGVRIQFDGTDADLYRALVEACGLAHGGPEA